MASSQDSTTSQPSFHWHYAEFDDRNFQIRGRTLFFIIVLFSIIITVTLLFVYARWVCRYHNLLPLTTSHAPHAPPLATQSQGLDPAAVSKLPITLHRASDEEAECCICLGVIDDGEKVKVLPTCRHCYHSECVDRWLVAHSSCPMCRTPIRVDSDVSTAITVSDN